MGPARMPASGRPAALCLADALDLPDSGLLAIVGAGGKTTAMYRLARELGARGLRVACTTTTKIFPPAAHQAGLILAENNKHFLEACRDAAATGKPVCLAWAADGVKLLGLDANFIHNLKDSRVFDWILVEADGARRLPLKAPADHEPVIPSRSTHVLAVAGLTGIGRPLDEKHVCRSVRFMELTGLEPGAPVTAGAVASICAHADGVFKGAPQDAVRLLLLNQADSPGAAAHGNQILDKLRDSGALPHRACLGAAGRNRWMEVWP